MDIYADGRKDLSPETRLAGNAEYLSSYIYRLVFNDNYAQAISSEVQSSVSLTHAHKGLVPSVSMERFQTFASPTSGNEARILHLPNLRFDAVDQPLGDSRFYWGMGSSLGYMGRSVPNFHARNVGRIDIYPHLSLPLSSGGWSIVPEGRAAGHPVLGEPGAQSDQQRGRSAHAKPRVADAARCRDFGGCQAAGHGAGFPVDPLEQATAARN